MDIISIQDSEIYNCSKELSIEYAKTGMPIRKIFYIDKLGDVDIYFGEKASRDFEELDNKLSMGSKLMSQSIFMKGKDTLDFDYILKDILTTLGMSKNSETNL